MSTTEQEPDINKLLTGLVSEVSHTSSCLEEEWKKLTSCYDLKNDTPFLPRNGSGSCGGEMGGDWVTVRRSDLQKLCSEVMQFKQILPKLVDKKYFMAYNKLPQLEEKLRDVPRLQSQIEELKSDITQLHQEKNGLKSRLNASIAQCQTEKQENRSLRQEVSLLSEQLSQQSEYCTGLGTACCTLLWRVSQDELAVQTMLTGSTIDAFLSLLPSTLESYISAYKDDWPSPESPESKFVMSLCGTVTNIAASAFGREFLVTNQRGLQLVDSYLKTVTDAPKVKAEKLKCLLIMALYNLTINQKGLQHLAAKPGLVQLFTWLLKDETNGEIRLHSLHLIQSLICDENNTKALNEFIEMQPLPLLQKLAGDRDSLVSQTATEIIMDLETFCTEQ